MGQLGWGAHLNQTYTTRWVSLHQAKASAWEQVTSGDQIRKKEFIICGGEIEYCLLQTLPAKRCVFGYQETQFLVAG